MLRAIATLMVLVGLVNPVYADDEHDEPTETLEVQGEQIPTPDPRQSFEPRQSELAQFQISPVERDLIGGGSPSAPFVASGMSMFAASAADIATTEWGLSRGLVEGNPIVAQRGVRIATHVAGPLAVYWATEKLRKSGRGKLAWALRLSITAAYGFAAAHNARMIGQTPGTPPF